MNVQGIFSPNPAKLKGPLFLQPGARLQVSFNKHDSEGFTHDSGQLYFLNIGSVSALKWKFSAGDLLVSYNHDIKTGVPANHFIDNGGTVFLNKEIKSISFTSDARQNKGGFVSLDFM